MKKENKKKTEENKQYELGLKEPFSNRFWKWRSDLSEKFVRMEKYRFLRNTPFWLLVSLLILMNFLIFDYYRELLEVAPDMVPLLNNYIQLEPRLVDIEQLYILTLFTGIFSLILLLLSGKIFNRKPYFSALMLITTFLSLIAALINIISLTNQYL